jgi:NTE family protein
LTGYAWEVGILKGLRDAGIDLTVADLIIGTSAGSILGTQIRSGKAVDDLYASMLAPPSGGSPPARSPADVQYLQDTYRLWLTGAENTATMRVEVGKRALETPHPIAEEAQKNRWRRMLGISEWPNQPLKISAVDITDGAVRFFDRSQDVGIETAAAASTAIPGLHAPITVGDRRYMDGGVATTGIDAALGYGTVVAITTGGGQLVRQQVELVRSGGSRIVNVSPDAESLSALGTDRMVASQAKPSAEALALAEFIIIFTTLRPEELTTEEILELYRLRWQIELRFKHLKSLLDLGCLPKYDAQSCRAWIQAKLLCGLLIERLMREAKFFFPWGYRLPASESLARIH